MGIFKRSGQEGGGSRHSNEFRRKIGRISKRDLPDLIEGHLGELGVAVLVLRSGREEQLNNAIWEAQRLCEEIGVMLQELDEFA